MSILRLKDIVFWELKQQVALRAIFKERDGSLIAKICRIEFRTGSWPRAKSLKGKDRFALPPAACDEWKAIAARLP
jgi:hypothetical protein